MLRPLAEYPFALRPMIVAHRGDTSFGARENSVEATAAATISGADMIEVDVQMSSDGYFVCHHDEKIDSGRAIWQLALSELRDAGVSTLAEVLDVAKEKVYLNLEIKEYSSRDPRSFMQKLTALVEQQKLQEHVLFTSFRLDYIRESGWHIPTCIIRPDDGMQRFFNARAHAAPIDVAKPLAEYLPSELLQLSKATGYACSIAELNARDLADIHKYNIFLSVYTVTTDEEFRMAVDQGAQGLVCEDPRHFAELRNSMFPSVE